MLLLLALGPARAGGGWSSETEEGEDLVPFDQDRDETTDDGTDTQCPGPDRRVVMLLLWQHVQPLSKNCVNE